MLYNTNDNLGFYQKGSEITARARLRGQRKGTCLSEQREKDDGQPILQGEHGQQNAIETAASTNC